VAARPPLLGGSEIETLGNTISSFLGIKVSKVDDDRLYAGTDLFRSLLVNDLSLFGLLK